MYDVPGNDSCPTSGTTMRVPVKSHRSPACAVSTASARKIISTLKIIITLYYSEVYILTCTYIQFYPISVFDIVIT